MQEWQIERRQQTMAIYNAMLYQKCTTSPFRDYIMEVLAMQKVCLASSITRLVGGRFAVTCVRALYV